MHFVNWKTTLRSQTVDKNLNKIDEKKCLCIDTVEQASLLKNLFSDYNFDIIIKQNQKNCMRDKGTLHKFTCFIIELLQFKILRIQFICER